MCSWTRERLLTPVFWPEEFHGLYSPWDRKESGMTEGFHFHLECATGHSHRTEFEFVNEKTTEISFIIYYLFIGARKKNFMATKFLGYVVFQSYQP